MSNKMSCHKGNREEEHKVKHWDNYNLVRLQNSSKKGKTHNSFIRKVTDPETSLSSNRLNFMIVSIITRGESKYPRYIAFFSRCSNKELGFPIFYRLNSSLFYLSSILSYWQQNIESSIRKIMTNIDKDNRPEMAS